MLSIYFMNLTMVDIKHQKKKTTPAKLYYIKKEPPSSM